MPLPSRTGMPLHFGIRIVSADKDRIVGEMEADERHLNAFGILHGGALMAFGDDLGGLGSRFHIPPGARTTTIESKTNFSAPAPPAISPASRCRCMLVGGCWYGGPRFMIPMASGSRW